MYAKTVPLTPLTPLSHEGRGGKNRFSAGRGCGIFGRNSGQAATGNAGLIFAIRPESRAGATG